MLSHITKTFWAAMLALAMNAQAFAADQGWALAKGYFYAEYLSESMESILKSEIQQVPEAANALEASQVALVKFKELAKEGVMAESEAVFNLKYTTALSKLSIARSALTRTLTILLRQEGSQGLQKNIKVLADGVDKTLALFNPS